jgi:glucosamine-6-phosphate deaminase
VLFVVYGKEQLIYQEVLAMDNFTFSPSKWLPFRDAAVLERVRQIKREDLEKHPNPDFKIKVIPDDFLELIWITDMFHRIKQAADEDRQVVLILPNPAPTYQKLAYLINRFRVNCKKLYTFNMDEYADEQGNIAPESYPQGFMNATKRFLYSQIDADLRPPENQIQGPTTKNIKDYSKMIRDRGEADACYSGPGWTGHIAFIDPDTPEFAAASLEEWKQMGARVVTLNPFTIAQNSLHGSFGMSGAMGFVPPRAATIGPRDVLAAKFRFEMHGLTTAGTFASWQRMISRMVLHGPVTPQVPSSILQTVPTSVYVTETIAANIEPLWHVQY